ncbi:hypothetical protein L1049_004083 [Liquidambar formosana]|uniref:Disease resistance protein n=1 Tax=Liquidambar formosana TaxID=63359 RepID=A0AAP0RNX2_LIQFO
MNVESSVSIVDLVSRLWDCTAAHASYICNLEGDLDDLRTAIEELKESRNDVMAKVNTAEEGQQMKRLDQVQGWLSRVEVMESEVDKLIRDGSQEVE